MGAYELICFGLYFNVVFIYNLFQVSNAVPKLDKKIVKKRVKKFKRPYNDWKICVMVSIFIWDFHKIFTFDV